MKRFTNFFVFLAVMAIITLAFMPDPANADERLALQDSGITFPKDIQEIIDNKCMGCHKPDSRNNKAKEKLQWELVSKMNKEDQEHFIDEMFEVLEDGKMPPKKAVERRPQMKLTDEETKLLITWVEKEEKRLKGK